MKSSQGLYVFLLCAASTFAVGSSGCTVGGKSFYIDSNSRVPFFGLELKDRKPKSSGPTYNSISRSGIDKSRIEAALGTGPVTSRGLLKRGDRRLASARISGVVEGSPDQSEHPQLVAKNRPVFSVPLPRTDGPSTSPNRHATSSVIDFQ